MSDETIRDLGLSPEQREVRQVARACAQAKIAPRVAEFERRGEYPRELVAECAALGFLGARFPERYGGSALDWLSYGLILEEIGRADWVSGSIISVHNSLVGPAVLRHGTEVQRERYLPPLARGERLACAALTEPGAGSDLGGIRTTARRAGDRYRLSGSKLFISHGTAADLFFVLATTDPALGHRGMVVLLLERDQPGLKVSPIPMHTLRRNGLAEVVFEDCEVPLEQALGVEGEGFRIVAESLDDGRLSVAAIAVGLAQACLDAAVAYATQREQFGQPIGRFQLVQGMLADMAAGVEAARRLVYWVAGLRDHGVARISAEAAMAKCFAADVAMKAALDAVEIHGGYGLAEEYPVGRLLAEAKALQIGEGTNEIQRLLVAEHLLGYRERGEPPDG